MHTPPSSRHLLLVPLLALVTALLLGACAMPSAPEVPGAEEGTADPVLVEGRSVWIAQCARCHGSAGEGGSGPQLSEGVAADRFPQTGDMVEVVASGRGAMPGFRGMLGDAEIEAVVRYVREVL